MVTYYVVQTFQKGRKGQLVPDQPRLAESQAQCEALAERLAERAVAVVAFSRTGEPETGAWADAVIIAEYGQVPEGMLEMTA